MNDAILCVCVRSIYHDYAVNENDYCMNKPWIGGRFTIVFS